MARARKNPPKERQGVTSPRAARLVRLLVILSKGAQTRPALMRQLKLDLRGFYRDLVLVRDAGVAVVFEDGRYHLRDKLEDAIAKLPCPDPGLTLGEAAQVAKGKSAAHKKLQDELALVMPQE